MITGNEMIVRRMDIIRSLNRRIKDGILLLEPGGQSSSGGNYNSYSSSSWDDWDTKDNRKEDTSKVTTSHSNDSWAGWDDAKDDGYHNFYNGASDNKAVGHNGKSDAAWTGGGFL